jgi:P27 family predicted phage terminase small subunit
LREAGVMTELDGPALALVCTAWARWRDAEEKVDRFGAVVQGSHGQLMRSPYTRISAQAADQLLRLLVEFGMTPSSRSRVHGLSPSAEVDPVEEWINGKH